MASTLSSSLTSFAELFEKCLDCRQVSNAECTTNASVDRGRCLFSLFTEFQRHGSIWYPDGNVILVSESRMFRVHKSILETHSPVFGKLIQIPPKSIGKDYFDDCPMIYVPESISDLTLFLEIIYNRSPRYEKSSIPPKPQGSKSLCRFSEDPSVPLTHVAICLNLGTKYQTEVVLQEAIRILRAECPSSNRGLNALRYRETPLIQESDKPGEKYISILNLARRYGLKLIMPWCLYMCIQLPVETLIRGIITPGGERERLSEEDLVLCFKGKEELACASMAVAERFRCDGVVCGEAHCQKEMEEWEKRRVFSEMKPEFFRPDPLGFNEVLYPMDHYNFCRACRTNIDSIRKHQQQDIFKYLPNTLGLWQ